MILCCLNRWTLDTRPLSRLSKKMCTENLVSDIGHVNFLDKHFQKGNEEVFYYPCFSSTPDC